ncbi:MAG: CsgG/HfaB family protein [bacterium]|nr:CsgG/HfaB family protein [bacterium]
MTRDYTKILSLACFVVMLAGCGGVQLQVMPKEKLSASIKTIAILEFADVRQAKEKEAHDNPAPIIQEKIISALVNQGMFRVIERQQLEKIIAEQKLQMSGLIDNSSAVEIGKILGADGIMVGSITEYGRTIYPKARLTVNVRVIEVKTGLIKWATEIKGRKANYAYPIELLKDIIDETVAKIVAQIQ